MAETIFISVPLDTLIEKIEERMTPRFRELLSENSKQQTEIFLSGKQAATVLNISAPTLRRWRIEGLVPYHRFGRQIKYKRSELDEAGKSLKRYGRKN